jgi:hypothetical protein
MRQDLGFQGAPDLCKVSLVLAGEAALLTLELAQLAVQLTARHVQVRNLQHQQHAASNFNKYMRHGCMATAAHDP